MLKNITKLFGYAGGVEGVVEPEPYDIRCEPGNCNGEGEGSYYVIEYVSSRGGWYYSGTCC